jgi:endogenous inhibitor of DNA gyrase (YacG/DUF329 family)
MTGPQQRTCPACGTTFTWTPAAPRQKFCSTRCRQRWWDRASRRQRRERQDDYQRSRQDGTRQPDDQHGRPDDQHGRPDDQHGRGDDPRRDGPPAATAACPHCRKPVTIVAWLVPPAAASVPAPLCRDP